MKPQQKEESKQECIDQFSIMSITSNTSEDYRYSYVSEEFSQIELQGAPIPKYQEF